jgi:hypothetical protein
MSVDLPLLLIGIVLLWFPRQWMRLGKVFGGKRRRSRSDREPWKNSPGDPRLTYAEFGKPRNYFDLLRGAAGALAIVGWHAIEPAIQVAASGGAGASRKVLAVKLAILLVGLLIQVIRRERGHLSFYAPIFYLAGMSVALCGPWAALFAFLLVWAVNPMFGNAEGFLTVYAILLVGFSLLFKDVSRTLAIGAFIFGFLPVLLSLLVRRPLVVFTRKPAQGT